MKIKVIEKAWYKKTLLEEGSVIDFYGDTVPVWGTLADGEQVSECELNLIAQSEKQKDETKQNEGNHDNSGTNLENQNEDAQNGIVQELNDQDYQSDEQKNEAIKELETLKDLAVENDVWVDIDEEKMTIPEQIAKFKEALKV